MKERGPLESPRPIRLVSPENTNIDALATEYDKDSNENRRRTCIEDFVRALDQSKDQSLATVLTLADQVAQQCKDGGQDARSLGALLAITKRLARGAETIQNGTPSSPALQDHLFLAHSLLSRLYETTVKGRKNNAIKLSFKSLIELATLIHSVNTSTQHILLQRNGKTYTAPAGALQQITERLAKLPENGSQKLEIVQLFYGIGKTKEATTLAVSVFKSSLNEERPHDALLGALNLLFEHSPEQARALTAQHFDEALKAIGTPRGVDKLALVLKENGELTLAREALERVFAGRKREFEDALTIWNETKPTKSVRDRRADAVADALGSCCNAAQQMHRIMGEAVRDDMWRNFSNVFQMFLAAAPSISAHIYDNRALSGALSNLIELCISLGQPEAADKILPLFRDDEISDQFGNKRGGIRNEDKDNMAVPILRAFLMRAYEKDATSRDTTNSDGAARDDWGKALKVFSNMQKWAARMGGVMRFTYDILEMSKKTHDRPNLLVCKHVVHALSMLRDSGAHKFEYDADVRRQAKKSISAYMMHFPASKRNFDDTEIAELQKLLAQIG